MRLRALLGATCAVMMVTAASAQTPETSAAAAAPTPPSRCGPVPEAPAAPDGSTAEASAIQAALAEYESWRVLVEANLACRHQEATEARALADARALEFNAANATARETSAAFQTAADAYNERHPRQRRVGR